MEIKTTLYSNSGYPSLLAAIEAGLLRNGDDLLLYNPNHERGNAI